MTFDKREESKQDTSSGALKEASYQTILNTIQFPQMIKKERIRTRHSGGYNSNNISIIRVSKDATSKDQEPNQLPNEKFDVDVFESFLNDYESNMNKQKYDLQSYKRTEDSQY